MTPQVNLRQLARFDLTACALQVGATTPETSARFLEMARSTMLRIADHPRLGESCEYLHPTAAPVRRCRVDRFKKFLIYYMPIEGGIEVLRVVHAARDQTHLLEGDDPG